MFFCEPCRQKRNWPDSIMKSYGRCECCGKTATCNDVPSVRLPMNPALKHQIDAWTVKDGEYERYFLQGIGGPWYEVTREKWVQAERSAGFRPHDIDRGQPATGGFSNGVIKGRTIDTRHSKPESYDWDPEFAKVVWPSTHA